MSGVSVFVLTCGLVGVIGGTFTLTVALSSGDQGLNAGFGVVGIVLGFLCLALAAQDGV